MNPVLIILVVLGVIALWFLMSFAFIPLGKIIYQIGKDAFDNMKKDENENSKENK